MKWRYNFFRQKKFFLNNSYIFVFWFIICAWKNHISFWFQWFHYRTLLSNEALIQSSLHAGPIIVSCAFEPWCNLSLKCFMLNIQYTMQLSMQLFATNIGENHTPINSASNWFPYITINCRVKWMESLISSRQRLLQPVASKVNSCTEAFRSI